MAKRTAPQPINNEDDQPIQGWAQIRAFMDSTESCLLDTVISTRVVNPQKSICELHFACAEGDLAKVKRCIEMRADINQCFLDMPHGSTPLHWAATASQSQIVELLLKKHADPNLRTKRECTPLHVACQHNNITTIVKLVQAGADPRATDKSGKVPLNYLMSDPDELYRGLTEMLAPDENNASLKLKSRIEGRMEAISAHAQSRLSLTLPPAPPSTHRSQPPPSSPALAPRDAASAPAPPPSQPWFPAAAAAVGGGGGGGSQGLVTVVVGHRPFVMHRRIIMRERKGRLAALLHDK